MSYRNSSTHNQDYKVIEELSLLLHGESGKLAIEGHSKLVLTVAAISCLNRKVRNLNLDEVVNNDIIVLKPGCKVYSHHDNILFLHQFIKKMPSLKVIPGLRTVQGSVNLTNFSKLTCLELERIPIHLFKGLQLLRSRIKVISCRRCLRLVQELFSSCGGDHASPLPWLELQSARLSHNDISNLDDSLKLLPMITSLDLSHNNIVDTDGLENLTKLEYLNLNYNCLSQFPYKVIPCVYLKVLLLKNNCLESLSGLENLKNLMEVDLSYNCIVDHCNLSVFNKLHKLTKLCLEGNPISYHQEHRILTIQHLNKKCYSLKFVLDGTPLTKNEFKNVRMCDYCTGDVSLRFIQSQNDETGDCSSISNHGEFESSNELVVESVPIRRRTRIKMTAREAQIDDGIVVDLDLSLSKSIQPSELSNSAHLQTKQEIEMCREVHGKEWLIIGARSSMLSKSILENDYPFHGTTNDPNTPKLEDHRLPVDPAQRLARISQVSDDVIVLNEEPESFFEPYNNMSVLQINVVNDASLESNQLTDHSNSSDEYEEDDESFQPFIVYSEKPECTEPVIILLVLKNNQLCEKDFITGRTIDKLDVRCLKSIELLESKKMLVDGAECELPRLKIIFNHIRKNRRERIYSMEDEKNFKLFYNWINEIADAKTLQQATSGAFQCLKCNSIFSKDMVSKVIENVNQPDDINILSSSSEAFKDLVRVNACPNCFSKMIIEVDSLDKDTLKFETEEFNQSTPLSGSYKLSSCKNKSVVSNDFSENWLKHSSPKNVPNSNLVAENFSSSSLKSDKSSCNNFNVQAEVHELPTTLRNSLPDVKPIDLEGNLKRWESDITILSNPSQSSILVLTHQTMADLNLDAIPEDSGAIYNSVSKSPAVSNRLTKMNSCSSDSLTDSACTAIDNHGHFTNTYLGQTPDSYLSALSGANAIEISEETCKSKHSEKMKFGIDLDVFMKCNTSSAGNSLPLLWSSRDNDLVYSFHDFGRLDHRLKLHLDMHILDNEEEPIITLRAGVIPYLKDEEFLGILVMCRSKVYILKITLEKEFSSNWLQKIDCLPINSLAYLNVHLGGQAFQMEFASAPSPVAYTFLLRDDDHCNSFICFLTERVKACIFEINRAVFKIDLDSEETLQVIQEQLFTWRNCKESLQEHSSSLDLLKNEDAKSNDENVYFYVMCYWHSSENQTSFRPVSIVITRSDIFIFKENLLWPLPHLISPSNELLNRPQIIPQIREKIQDLTSITKSASRTFEVILKFLDEDTGEELNLRIGTETERSLQMLIQALKDPWEKLFEVELQVHQEDS